MIQLELKSRIARHRPSLLPLLEHGRPEDGVAALNEITGLRLKHIAGKESEICAKFFDVLRKQKIESPFDSDSITRACGIPNSSLQDRIRSQFLGSDHQNLAAQAALIQQYAGINSVPIPPPEPNKVLLLLGDDE